MERLQRLELSKGYVELLKEAEELRYVFTDAGGRDSWLIIRIQ
jgi:hypothetical protein